MFYILQVTWISAHALYVPTHNSYHEDLCSVIRKVLVNFLKCAHAGHKCLCIFMSILFIIAKKLWTTWISTGERRIDTQVIVYPYIGALSYRIKLLFCSMTSKLLPRERRWTDRSWWPSKVRKENASLCLAGKLRSSDQLSNSPRSQHHDGRKLKYPKWRSRGGRTNQPDSTSYRYLVV